MTDLVPVSSSNLMASQPASLNPAVVYLASLKSVQSQRTMRAALNTLADLLQPEVEAEDHQRYRLIPWHQLRYQHTAAIQARMSQSELKPATVNKILSALRGVLREAWRLGLMSGDDYQQARAVKGIDSDTLPAGRDIDDGEIRALVGACKRDASPSGARDLAMIGLLYAAGLRRSELVKLDREHVNVESGRMEIRGAKRLKDRTVFISGGALVALQRWLAVRSDEPGPLVCRIRKGGKLLGTRLTTQAVYTIMQERGKEAGLSRFTPHDFRRTLAGNLLDSGVDIATVSNILGHSNIETTRRYDRRPEEVKRQAATKVHFPV